MIFLGMKIQEIQHQVANDYQLLHRWVTAQSPSIRGWFERQKDVSTNLMQWRSKNGNLWYVMLWRSHLPDPEMAYFTTLESSHGKFVIRPQMGSKSMNMIVYLPHHFKRYRERMKIGSRLSPMQLIRRFIRRNSSGTSNSFLSKNKKLMYYEVTTSEGIGLGVWVGLRARLIKTFITPDMAYGDQVERYERLEEMRKDDVLSNPYYTDEVTEEIKMFGLSDDDFMADMKKKNEDFYK